jgi:hypothetical protein
MKHLESQHTNAQQALFLDFTCALPSANDSGKKTYRAIRHDITRQKQKGNNVEVHHPHHKTIQIKKVLSGIDLSILELFAGHGNCTKVYSNYGEVTAFEKSASVFQSLLENTKECQMVQCHRADSYLEYHRLLFLKLKFDVVDIDPYGFPNRFFPDIFLLIDDGILFVTMPKPYVNILNGITATHLISYYGEQNPSENTIVERICLWGLCHWRKVELIDSMDCNSVWRFAFSVKKVKATEYTGVKNR